MIEDFRFLCSVADQLLLERGEYDPFELLLSAGFLDDEDYREWRHGRSDALQDALLCDVEEAVAALTQAQTYILAQKLSIDVRAPTSWDKEARALRVGSSKTFAKLCAAFLVRPSGRAQTDLFHDSTQTVAAHAVRNALAEHRLDAAHEALERLEQVAGSSAEVTGYRQLLAAIESAAAPADRLREIEEVIAPLAARFLSQRARDYLAPLWQALARRLSKTVFSPAQPKLHSSYANTQARRWKRVVEVIEAEADWDQQPILMTRLAEAYARLARKQDARRTWSRLCWEHPRAAGNALAATQADSLLANRWHEFIEVDAEIATQDFPAWLLIADLRQRELVPGAQAPDNDTGRAYAAMFRLVTGDGAIAARAAVNEARPVLLQQYLARRSAVTA